MKEATAVSSRWLRMAFESSRFYMLRKTPTTVPRIMVGLKSVARTKMGAMDLFAGWNRM
jgi:hypothetical protein